MIRETPTIAPPASRQGISVVGRGLLARAFAVETKLPSGTIVFASGVSNSGTTDVAAFAREEVLLRSWLASAAGIFVYFSSCGLATGDTAHSAYMAHKRNMEELVLGYPAGRVFRLPQVVGQTDNPHTLVNYLREHLLDGTPFEVWEHAERNIIGVDDVRDLVVAMLGEPATDERIVNIAALHSTPMAQLVRMMEDHLGRHGHYTLVPRGEPMPLDTAQVARVARRLGLDLGPDYATRVIARYCLPGDIRSS